MKKFFKYVYYIILSWLTIFTACKKDEGLNTKLQLKFYGDNVGEISNAKVTLYTSIEDMLAGTNPATKTKITDENGIVVFDSLEPITYYWKIDEVCYTNNYYNHYSHYTLEKFKTTYISEHLMGNSSLIITNNTQTRYDIDIDRLGYRYLRPNDTIEFHNIWNSDYQVKLIKPETETTAYSDTTFTIVVPCNDTVLYLLEE